MENILVTGGAGYLGSHMVTELLQRKFEVVVIDNLSNSSFTALERASQITGKKPEFYLGDLTNPEDLRGLFSKYSFDAVIHFAGLKSVSESFLFPENYYRNNFGSSMNLCEAMRAYGVNKLIFSSSATVYGSEAAIPYIESANIGRQSSPYGSTKAITEKFLGDICISDDHFQVISLRYFNPIGAHESGLIGEDPLGEPNNLLPIVAQVASRKRKMVRVFGNDYATPDGTCRRDYIHVLDLMKGHEAALDRLLDEGVLDNYQVFNLGTGKATSVLEMIRTFESTSGVDIPFQFCPRRSGDLPEFWADSTKAKNELGWECVHSLEKMVYDAWNWEQKNPEGYRAITAQP